MLVVTRKKDESIVISSEIVISVVEIRGDKVRLGIVCPKELPVHRSEIFEAIHGKPLHQPVGPADALANDIAILEEQIEQGDTSADLAQMLAEKRLQLAALGITELD